MRRHAEEDNREAGVVRPGLRREASQQDQGMLLSAAYVLTGLRVSRQVADQLFKGVSAMKESSTYQAILDEGAASALQKTLLRLGRRRFGCAAPDEVEASIVAITDLERLQRLTERLLDVANWQELLASP